MVSPEWMRTSREKKSVYSKTRPALGCWLAGSAQSTPIVRVCGAGAGLAETGAANATHPKPLRPQRIERKPDHVAYRGRLEYWAAQALWLPAVGMGRELCKGENRVNIPRPVQVFCELFGLL